MAAELSDAEIQRKYYADTAQQYEQMHISEKDEHTFALSLLVGLLDFLDINSVLDIGSGTGRAITFLRQHKPGLRVIGIEPVKELREIGYSQGLSRDVLIDGDATKLPYKDGEFDLVCEFAVLHHIKPPGTQRAVAEMLRVARKAVFISDSNNFGQGSALGRGIKQVLHALRLWPIANYLKTGGKGYIMSEGDGLAYSYSLFDNYAQVRAACKTVHVINTGDASGVNPYRAAPHAAILGIK
jgi:SAM-dependent methyltransferase